MSNRIDAPMYAPDNGSSKFNLLPNLQIPDEGPRQMILMGIIDIGTHTEKSGQAAGQDKRKMIAMFEKSDLWQRVYEEDTEPRAWQRSDTMGYSMYKNAKLFKIAKAIVGGKYNDDQLEKGIDLRELLGGRCYVTVVHKPNPKDANNPYVNFENFSRVGNDPAPANFTPSNQQYYFFIDDEGKNFMTENFSELPAWIRKQIMESKEAIEYASKGGKFAEPTKEDENQSHTQQQQAPATVTSQIPAGYQFKDLSGQNFSYEQYKTAGWTDKQLYKQGWLTALPQQAPAPTSPAPSPNPAPAGPSNPTPQQQASTQQPQTNFAGQPIQNQQPAQQAPVQQQTQQAPAQNVSAGENYNPFDGDDDDDLPF